MKEARSLAARVLGLTILCLAVAGAALSAQTYTACRVPDVGAIYMIGVGGAPTACLDPSHVEFSWTETGVADGSITEAKLADDAVTTNKIADETVTAGNLAANSVGSAELQSNSVGLFEMQDNSVGPQALGLEVVSVERSVSNDTHDQVVATCPAGKRVLAGGYRLGTFLGVGVDEMNVVQNGPYSDTQWVVEVDWSSIPSIWSWTAYAICIIDGT